MPIFRSGLKDLTIHQLVRTDGGSVAQFENRPFNLSKIGESRGSFNHQGAS